MYRTIYSVFWRTLKEKTKKTTEAKEGTESRNSTYPILGITNLKDNLSALPADERSNLGKFPRGALALDTEGLLGDAVAEEARRVPPPAQQERRVVLGRGNDGLLDLAVHGRLLGAQEASAHVDTAGAEAQGGRKALAVGEAARGDEGHVKRLARAREQDKVGDVRLANVAALCRLDVSAWLLRLRIRVRAGWPGWVPGAAHWVGLRLGIKWNFGPQAPRAEWSRERR